jgi:mono/diheme cytochrome c family protein
VIRAAVFALAFAAAMAAAAEPHKWTAPDADKARVNPVEATPAALLKGRALYQKHCASCHGDKGKGDGPAESYEVEPATDGLHRVIEVRPGVRGVARRIDSPIVGRDDELAEPAGVRDLATADHQHVLAE